MQVERAVPARPRESFSRSSNDGDGLSRQSVLTVRTTSTSDDATPCLGDGPRSGGDSIVGAFCFMDVRLQEQLKHSAKRREEVSI